MSWLAKLAVLLVPRMMVSVAAKAAGAETIAAANAQAAIAIFENFTVVLFGDGNSMMQIYQKNCARRIFLLKKIIHISQ
jgi:hypothetical protein